MRRVVVGALALLCGCEMAPPDEGRCVPLEPPPVEDVGAGQAFVVSRLDLPTTDEEVANFAVDLDGDGDVDNAFGSIIRTIDSLSGFDLDAKAQELVDAGLLLHLLDVHRAAGDGVLVRLLHGVDLDMDPGDNFSGDEEFAIAARPRGQLTGTFRPGVLAVEHGTAPIAITFSELGNPYVLPLRYARIDARQTRPGWSGTIAGGISPEAVDTVLIPVLAEGLNRIVERDCPSIPCEPSSTGDVLLELFDENGDSTIGVEELRNNSLVRALLAPDVDLESERYDDPEPQALASCDGVKDHLSVAIRFEAVPAVLAP